MAVNILIVSGFLGTGKTTFIKECIRRACFAENTVILENDFGSTNLDAAVLEHSQFVIEAMSAGCICCSLSTDLVTTLKRLISRYQPSTIVIEPSGVAKLSDLLFTLRHPDLADLIATPRSVVTLDVHNHALYQKNFGAFYDDQLRYADYFYPTFIADESPDEVLATLQATTNQHAVRLDSLDREQFEALFTMPVSEQYLTKPFASQDQFRSYTLTENLAFTAKTFTDFQSYIKAQAKIVRIKGQITIDDQPYSLQYSLAGLNVSASEPLPLELVIIETKKSA